MKPLHFLFVILAGVTLIASAVLSQNGPPKQEKLVFENQFIKVYEATLQPGEKLTSHHGGNRLIYSLNDYKLIYRWEGKFSEENRKAGDVHFHPEATHTEENPGKTAARFLIVERQAAPLPPANGTGADMAAANPNCTKVIFDRDMAKVWSVTLQPKQTASMHYGLDRLLYAQDGTQLLMTGADGTKSKQNLKKGGCQWFASGLHELQNAGPGATRLVVFGFRK